MIPARTALRPVVRSGARAVVEEEMGLLMTPRIGGRYHSQGLITLAQVVLPIWRHLRPLPVRDDRSSADSFTQLWLHP